MEKLKQTLESIGQVAIFLLQMTATFLIKPDIFNIYGSNGFYTGGNFYYFILIFITIIFIYLSFSYKKRIHAIKWLLVCIIFSLAFGFTFYKYNDVLDSKTILFAEEGLESARYIKGNNYKKDIQLCANEVKDSNGNISDIDVIRNCTNIKGASQLSQIWPENEIKSNVKFIYTIYCICLALASIALISGFQAIKCKRIKIE
jgi:energy-coupling factor transporter transmembrane protein EcfT